jgi:hypothetical protein
MTIGVTSVVDFKMGFTSGAANLVINDNDQVYTNN